MDKFWIDKVQKYISEHNAFENVSEITISDDNKNAFISAMVSVNLPSKYIKAGITEIGVKEKEYVQFVFPETFPLKAPEIYLRDDFPRCFPHINPSKKQVMPCIYEGNLSELLQQSEWMNGILNQLADWLEKAASNDLLNYDQGWEPMRNDHNIGFMQYDIDNILASFGKHEASSLIGEIYYEKRNKIILTGPLCNPEKIKKAHALYILAPRTINIYVPNTITNLGQLYEYADSIGLHEIKKSIKEIDLKFINEDKLFIVLSVKRPVNIIGTDSNIEFLNFVITKSGHRIKKRRELKRTLPDCKVGMMSHISGRSSALLKRISGMKTKIDEDKTIALVGCGSLGSKIGIHLARNGNGPFLCVDKDIFMPHNNARHALTLTWAQYKAELLSLSIFSIGKIKAESVKGNALDVDYSQSRVIIDTTASFSVRNFFMGKKELPSIISCGLYGKGRYGLLLSEDEKKGNPLTNIWANLYFETLTNIDIREALFSSNMNNVPIGQSCSSQTMIVDDARISLMAAAMSLKIQQILEIGLSKNSEILFVKYDDEYSLASKVYPVPECIEIYSLKERDWKVLITEPVIKKMRDIMHDKTPNETGGALLGSVFLYPKTIVITGIINAPSDSIESPSLFVLGVEGLEKKIKDTEKKTNGKVTYLGTWHSHPHGGKASPTDNRTFEKLLFVRNYEPTVCLIITNDEVILV